MLWCHVLFPPSCRIMFRVSYIIYIDTHTHRRHMMWGWWVGLLPWWTKSQLFMHAGSTIHIPSNFQWQNKTIPFSYFCFFLLNIQIFVKKKFFQNFLFTLEYLYYPIFKSLSLSASSLAKTSNHSTCIF